jgi:dipeptidyl-peptidase-4
MRKLTLLFTIAFIVSSHINFAQSKMLSMEDAIIGQWRHLYPSNIYGVWQPETSNFIFRKDGQIISFDAQNQKENAILPLKQLNKSLTESNIDTLNYIPRYSWVSKDKIYFNIKDASYIYDVAKSKIEAQFSFEKGDENFDNSFEANKKIAVTNGNSLFVVTATERITIAASENDETVYGQTVSRSEFGINKGTFWSNDGKQLAYYIKDNSDVKKYPLVDITTREAETDMIPYPMAGMSSEHISLGVYNFDTKKTVYIENQDPKSEKYLTNITWGPESRYIYIQVLNQGSKSHET